MNFKSGSCMCCRLTCFLLKIGAIEPLCCPLQIRTTNNNKGESTVPKFLKGVVSENVLLSEPLRLADLKTAPDFSEGKNGAIKPLWYPLQIRTTSRGGSIESTFPTRKLGAIAPLRFPKIRSAKGGSMAPNNKGYSIRYSIKYSKWCSV